MSTPHPIADDRHVCTSLVKVIGTLVALTFGLVAIVAAIT